MKRWAGRILIALAIIIGGGLLWWNITQGQSALSLAGYNYSMTVVKDGPELTRGLSGTDNLPNDQAMLFVFPNDDLWGIWMKDMNYPIDIVWLDSDRTVVHTVQNALPSSYPNTTFKPPVPARYVIELSSGTIERTGIKIGDHAGMPSGV
jgi:uncharacterized protein